jgi:predicted CDP-diglyceride synthetase/phosphatidate cytidylyltransferase
MVPKIDWALALGVLIAALVALATRRRGGRFRSLPGWSAFWLVFGGILIFLSHANRWISFALLAALMLISLRAYFFVAPVRPRDRYAILATYLSVPFALGPAFIGSDDVFLATVPVTLFLVVPVFLSIGKSEQGLLDAMGRTLLGVIFFVFCIAHLGLLIHQPYSGLPELFGILVLASELPQRLAGRFRPGPGWVSSALGLVASIILAGALGFLLGPLCGLVEEDGGRAGMLVALAVTLGAQVSNAVAQDLSLSMASSSFGRGAFFSRMVPAVYAAPVFFHYLNSFA